MHNYDDKYPAGSVFEPVTSKLQAPVDTNEPSGPANSLTHSLTGSSQMIWFAPNDHLVQAK